MLPEPFFKLSFVVLFVSAVAIRVHDQRLAGTYSQGTETHAGAAAVARQETRSGN
jgi:hypothetical protein